GRGPRPASARPRGPAAPVGGSPGPPRTRAIRSSSPAAHVARACGALASRWRNGRQPPPTTACSEGNPSPRPPPLRGEGEKDKADSPSPLRGGGRGEGLPSERPPLLVQIGCLRRGPRLVGRQRRLVVVVLHGARHQPVRQPARDLHQQGSLPREVEHL